MNTVPAEEHFLCRFPVFSKSASPVVNFWYPVSLWLDYVHTDPAPSSYLSPTTEERSPCYLSDKPLFLC